MATEHTEAAVSQYLSDLSASLTVHLQSVNSQIGELHAEAAAGDQSAASSEPRMTTLARLYQMRTLLESQLSVLEEADVDADFGGVAEANGGSNSAGDGDRPPAPKRMRFGHATITSMLRNPEVALAVQAISMLSTPAGASSADVAVVANAYTTASRQIQQQPLEPAYSQLHFTPPVHAVIHDTATAAAAAESIDARGASADRLYVECAAAQQHAHDHAHAALQRYEDDPNGDAQAQQVHNGASYYQHAAATDHRAAPQTLQHAAPAAVAAANSASAHTTFVASNWSTSAHRHSSFMGDSASAASAAAHYSAHQRSVASGAVTGVATGLGGQQPQQHAEKKRNRPLSEVVGHETHVEAAAGDVRRGMDHHHTAPDGTGIPTSSTAAPAVVAAAAPVAEAASTESEHLGAPAAEATESELLHATGREGHQRQHQRPQQQQPWNDAGADAAAAAAADDRMEEETTASALAALAELASGDRYSVVTLLPFSAEPAVRGGSTSATSRARKRKSASTASATVAPAAAADGETAGLYSRSGNGSHADGAAHHGDILDAQPQLLQQPHNGSAASVCHQPQSSAQLFSSSRALLSPGAHAPTSPLLGGNSSSSNSAHFDVLIGEGSAGKSRKGSWAMSGSVISRAYAHSVLHANSSRGGGFGANATSSGLLLFHQGGQLSPILAGSVVSSHNGNPFFMDHSVPLPAAAAATAASISQQYQQQQQQQQQQRDPDSQDHLLHSDELLLHTHVPQQQHRHPLSQSLHPAMISRLSSVSPLGFTGTTVIGTAPAVRGDGITPAPAPAAVAGLHLAFLRKSPSPSALNHSPSAAPSAPFASLLSPPDSLSAASTTAASNAHTTARVQQAQHGGAQQQQQQHLYEQRQQYQQQHVHQQHPQFHHQPHQQQKFAAAGTPGAVAPSYDASSSSALSAIAAASETAGTRLLHPHASESAAQMGSSSSGNIERKGASGPSHPADPAMAEFMHRMHQFELQQSLDRARYMEQEQGRMMQSFISASQQQQQQQQQQPFLAASQQLHHHQHQQQSSRASSHPYSVGSSGDSNRATIAAQAYTTGASTVGHSGYVAAPAAAPSLGRHVPPVSTSLSSSLPHSVKPFGVSAGARLPAGITKAPGPQQQHGHSATADTLLENAALQPVSRRPRQPLPSRFRDGAAEDNDGGVPLQVS